LDWLFACVKHETGTITEFLNKIKTPMNYKFDKKFLSAVCDSQYKDTLNSFSGCEMDDRYITIPYTDRNYTCAGKLEMLRTSKVQAISMFSGCGGLDIGTQMAGVKVISTMDFEPSTVETMRNNAFFQFAEHNCQDIRDIDGKFYSSVLRQNNPEKLILVGGPPCQPFSKGAYWITNEKRKGINDERNMVGEYLRMIDEIRPDGFLLENVESILHPTNRAIVEFIESRTEQMGYRIMKVRANAVDYGVPQRRKRVIFLASRHEIAGEPEKLSPQEAAKVNVLDWIARFDSPDLKEPEESTEGKTYDAELKAVPPGHNYLALTARDGYPNPRFIANKRFWNFLLKLHPLEPSWTISAQPGPWVGPFHWNNRRLRVSEIAAIQTFPMDFKISGSRRDIQKQIGNAVPSLMAQRFVEHLIKNI
jgi:DNA (cytosine-5)-methyltransferase 1